MVAEALAALDPRPGQTYLDGTLGLGGHAAAVASRLAPGGVVVGLDWDAEMLAQARARLAGVEGVAFYLFQSDFRGWRSCLAEAASASGRAPVAHCLLLDLGVNNQHLETAERGMSFLRPGPLDMRMDRRKPETAAQLLHRLSAREIEDMLLELGGERWARRIAAEIVARRKVEPLATTGDLVECVLAAVPPAKRERRIHPATRTFQAVRIAVNGELDELEEAVVDIADALAPYGAMAVLSYHSGEDRAVKRAFRSLHDIGTYSLMHKKPLTPSPDEVATNPKSRSAKMRSIRRVA
jgi:16S rRNA (cytosine1402-N4)-methyltransferase